ncbi:DNA mismatch repair protein MSH2 [Microbotryum lychnidis-dioicae p1A1 Lamole]|uniref:DNA mismatch repair protein MSH2 n=1 Tax=Microbotryum lychnidis-dioicae (strain p1A1 Lamole / MvSl-1064) TaxID=683840 RepID=U5HD15_USTV1|nr:DNA mismatch repair protein MSH2 [Microbotryum lychnidis-dioicae p1A1 Lamole]|eukprot:KDE04567.1 DNA mismatch repair protein MSH2 [Microbotryum lychnidis-dioicae p1A1 Lamole]
MSPPLQYGAGKVDDSNADQADNSFCDVIRKLPATPAGTVRLFDRGDFYSAFGTDAIYIATHHYKTQTIIKKLGKISSIFPDGLPAVAMSIAVAQGFLRDALTTKQLRIEIYESSGGKNASKWTLGKQASPGHLAQVEDLLFAHTDMLAAPVILALKLQVKDNVKTVGVTFADTSRQEMGVAEFIDNDLFSNTEALLIQLGVKEVLLPSEDKAADYDLKKIYTLVERCNIVLTDRKKNEFTAKDVEQDLNRLLRGDVPASTRPELDLKVAMASTAALIAYLGLMTDDSNFGSYQMVTHDLKQYMKLDASALRALNLMPDPTGMGSGGSKNMSVFGLLNRCKTSQGTRMLAQWLKQPLVNLHSIQQRQDLVECFFEDTALRRAVVNDYLKSMPDFHRISKRFQKGAANLEDVVRVYQALLLLPGLLTVLENGADGNQRWRELIDEVYLAGLKDNATFLQPMREMVEETIDLDELDRHQFVIKPEFDETLQELKQQLEQVRDSLDEEHQRVAGDLKMDADNKVLHFELSPLYGYCFRLTRKEGSAIKNKKGYIELKNQTNGVHFTTKQLKSLNDDHKDLTKQYEKKQSALVKEVIAIAASYCPVLETLNNLLAHLDVVASLATASLNAPISYVKPVVCEQAEGSLNLVDARHPCLEVMEGINFIANDISLERDVSEFQIITGPNMGGKSTFIRSAGVISLMAQIGCFVPCTSATVPIFDSILCRVGAGDSQLKGVSTFMAEMLETAAILKSATRDSLVIIDELGRGTSTYDGFGLAWAISEHLAKETRAAVLFASHFHELTALAHEIPHVKNLHVVAHVDPKPDSLTGKEITLLYKVEPGVCDQSFGIHVAELANFPEEVVKLAKRKADDLEDFSDRPGEAATTASTLSPEAIAEGTALVEEFLNAWASGNAAAVPGGDDRDAEMADADGEAEVAKEYASLLKVFETYKDRFESTEWTRTVLPRTY